MEGLAAEVELWDWMIFCICKPWNLSLSHQKTNKIVKINETLSVGICNMWSGALRHCCMCIILIFITGWLWGKRAALGGGCRCATLSKSNWENKSPPLQTFSKSATYVISLTGNCIYPKLHTALPVWISFSRGWVIKIEPWRNCLLWGKKWNEMAFTFCRFTELAGRRCCLWQLREKQVDQRRWTLSVLF